MPNLRWKEYILRVVNSYLLLKFHPNEKRHVFLDHLPIKPNHPTPHPVDRSVYSHHLHHDLGSYR
jgi:hypothetical protein